MECLRICQYCSQRNNETSLELGTTIIIILVNHKMRHREVKYCTQDRTVSKQSRHLWYVASLTPESVFLWNIKFHVCEKESRSETERDKETYRYGGKEGRQREEGKKIF